MQVRAYIARFCALQARFGAYLARFFKKMIDSSISTGLENIRIHENVVQFRSVFLFISNQNFKSLSVSDCQRRNIHFLSASTVSLYIELQYIYLRKTCKIQIFHFLSVWRTTKQITDRHVCFSVRDETKTKPTFQKMSETRPRDL
jgi:hypothetical protein